MRALHVAALAGLTVLAVTCRPTAPAGLSDADRAAIKQGDDQWVQLTSAKNWAAAAQLYSTDGLILPPNGPTISGQSAIESWLRAYPPFSDFTLEQITVEGRGDLAYVHGRYSLMVTPPGASAATRDEGKYVVLWKKQADGQWRAALGIFNSDLPLPAPEPPKR